MINQAKIGSLLKELRKEHGMTQEQLAEKIGVARRTVSRWETGSNLPDLDILIELSDLYGVGLREILDGERQEAMDRDMEETVIKVAEYSSAQSQRAKKVVLVYFVLGIIAIIACLVMEEIDFGDTFASGFAKGISYGIAVGAMIMGILYTTGVLTKFQAAKMRFLNR